MMSAAREEIRTNGVLSDAVQTLVFVQVKVKVNMDLYIAPRREHTFKALGYGTRSQVKGSHSFTCTRCVHPLAL